MAGKRLRRFLCGRGQRILKLPRKNQELVPKILCRQISNGIHRALCVYGRTFYVRETIERFCFKVLKLRAEEGDAGSVSPDGIVNFFEALDDFSKGQLRTVAALSEHLSGFRPVQAKHLESLHGRLRAVLGPDVEFLDGVANLVD